MAIHDTVCHERTGGLTLQSPEQVHWKNAAVDLKLSLQHLWYDGSLGHHHLHEFLVVDLTITVHICFADHLINFLISQFPELQPDKQKQRIPSNQRLALAFRETSWSHVTSLVRPDWCGQVWQLWQLSTLSVKLKNFKLFSHSKLLSKVGHHMAQLCCTDEAVAIAVEDLESFDQLLFRVSVLHSKFQFWNSKEMKTTPGTLLNNFAWKKFTCGNLELHQMISNASFILRAIKDKNSGKSMVPLPSASTSLIISWSSASVGFWPKEPYCLSWSQKKSSNFFHLFISSRDSHPKKN